MKVRRLEIQNFRGICKLKWDLPNEKTFCLIGKGDSTKTTVLDAIRCAFNPQWNHSFNDSDFHLCDTENAIRVEIVLGELLPEFCSDQKYGPHLRGWNAGEFKLNDEPEDNDEPVLSICPFLLRLVANGSAVFSRSCRQGRFQDARRTGFAHVQHLATR